MSWQPFFCRCFRQVSLTTDCTVYVRLTKIHSIPEIVLIVIGDIYTKEPGDNTLTKRTSMLHTDVHISADKNLRDVSPHVSSDKLKRQVSHITGVKSQLGDHTIVVEPCLQ